MSTKEQDLQDILRIPYQHGAGPLPVELLTAPIDRANCQRALQAFCFRKLGIPLTPFEALSEEGYLGTGQLVKDSPTDLEDYLETLQFGDIIYAVSGRTNTDQKFDPKKLHIAVFAGLQKEPQIFHGTYIDRQTTLSSLDSFLQVYTPVRVRRIVDENGSRLPNQFIPHPF